MDAVDVVAASSKAKKYHDTHSGSSTMLVGKVKSGDTFPTKRPDNSALILGDFVVPKDDATIPFTIAGLTFTNKNDKAYFQGGLNWSIEHKQSSDVDNKSIVNAGDKLSLKGYAEATQGQMFVKDATNGLMGVTPVSDAELQEKVDQASTYATQAGTSATQAESAKVAINQRIQIFNDMDEYDAAVEAGLVIDNYTISIILQDTLVGE